MCCGRRHAATHVLLAAFILSSARTSQPKKHTAQTNKSGLTQNRTKQMWLNVLGTARRCDYLRFDIRHCLTSCRQHSSITCFQTAYVASTCHNLVVAVHFTIVCTYFQRVQMLFGECVPAGNRLQTFTAESRADPSTCCGCRDVANSGRRVGDQYCGIGQEHGWNQNGLSLAMCHQLSHLPSSPA